MDPVANFHLQNGAQVHSLNWGGNLTPQGMLTRRYNSLTSHPGLRQSYGMMVNYLYSLPNLLDNSENYVIHHKIQVSDAVKSYLGQE